MQKIKNTLSDMQNKFIEEYLLDLNATSAAVRAGYSHANAGKIGSQLLGKTRVRDEIKKRIAERSARLTVTSDRILNDIIQLAAASPMDLLEVTEDGVKLNSQALSNPILCKLIESISFGKHGISLRFLNKTRLLSLALDHLMIGTTTSSGRDEVMKRLQTYFENERRNLL